MGAFWYSVLGRHSCAIKTVKVGFGSATAAARSDFGPTADSPRYPPPTSDSPRYAPSLPPMFFRLSKIAKGPSGLRRSVTDFIGYRPRQSGFSGGMGL